MLWFRQTPFLAVVVFGIGMGLGLAWKFDLIPVELGAAKTGSLNESDSDVIEDDGSLTNSSTPPDIIPSRIPTPPEDPEIFAAQSEPATPDETNPVAQVDPRNRPELLKIAPYVRPSARPERVAAAVHTADEPEWAQPTANRAGRTQAESHPRTNDASRNPRQEIRLAAAQAPPAREFEEATAEPAVALPIAEELKVIDEQIANDDFLAAHRALSKLYWNHREARSELLKRLQRTSRVIFFEPQPHFVEPYVVQANDKLSVIASKYQLSWEYVAKLNRTEPKRIQLGQKLKILKGPFAAVVDLHEFALTIHLQGYFVKRYEVGIGKDGASPLGKFTVLNKVENPQYTGPDGKVIQGDNPANPLGERWIDLGESYGIHGTIEPDSIGKAASRGCIRMRENDVIEVYDFLIKGSEVAIRK